MEKEQINNQSPDMAMEGTPISRPPREPDHEGHFFSFLSFASLFLLAWAGWKVSGVPASKSLTAVLTIFIPTLLIITINTIKERRSGVEFEIIPFVVLVFSGISISIIIAGTYFALLDTYDKIPLAPSRKFVIATGFAALAIGFTLYLARKKFRILWGITEVAVGAAIIMYRTSNNAGDFSKLNAEYFIAVLTAGLYLIVRGFDNMEQGRKAKLEEASKSPTSPK